MRRILRKKLPIPHVEQIQASHVQQSLYPVLCIEPVMIVISQPAADLLSPRKFGRQEKAKEQSSRFENASDLAKRSLLVGNVF
jgi:hypothetical protein